MSEIDREQRERQFERVQTRVEALLNAEQIALHSPMSRQERACRKATRDAYALVLDMMSEET